ncbi:carboxylating nicotinate-nucleotide diphosphorylase, partial [Candidatus Bathyarchaeota archaeon]|nr:carboxylating nicotinate-nucleotide diphosphorylase [Candidatus Bathyarchaeota archaeon]
MFMPRKVLEEKLKQILAEDIGQGDVTTSVIVPSGLTVEAAVIAKEAGIAAGIEEIVILAESLGLNVKTEAADGEEIRNGQVIMKISGNARTIISAERTMLNLLSRMSGIATTTRRLTEKLKRANSPAKIAATRKTAPGLLYFDKKAVLIGGGDPHRLHLDDMILVKDNHITIAGSVESAVKKAKQN